MPSNYYFSGEVNINWAEIVVLPIILSVIAVWIVYKIIGKFNQKWNPAVRVALAIGTCFLVLIIFGLISEQLDL